MQTVFALGADMRPILGVLSAVLSIMAYVPYMRDILRGKTQPQRACWLIWSLLCTMAFGAQYAEGATTTLWFAGAQVAGTLTVFLMSITYARGAFLTRPDERVVWIAVVGLVIWYFTEDAAYTLALTITISLLGGLLTLAKAYCRPGSETMMKWGLSFVAATCRIASVGTADWLLLAYPLYLFALNGMVVCAILCGRLAEGRTSGYDRRIA